MSRSKISIGIIIFFIAIISFATSFTVFRKSLSPVDDGKEARRVKRVAGNDAGQDVYDGYEYEESKEQECSNGKFWNIRSERCVPLRCPGGNKFRDLSTGECLVGNAHYASYGQPRSVWRSNSFSSHRMNTAPFRMGVGRFKG